MTTTFSSRINAPQPNERSSHLSATDFMRIARAIKFAHRSQLRVRVGAYVVGQGKRRAGAFNKGRNHPRIDYLQASTHAEIGALKQLDNVSGGTIYVARLGAKGRLLPSFPCHRCVPALIATNIKRIVWWDGEKWVATRLAYL